MKNVELIGMLDDKKRLETQVSSIIHGSIEVRDKECNKYIYVHYRDNGKLISRYVGEYSDELYNLILNNNIKIKELKKEIKRLNNILKEENVDNFVLSDKVKLNVDFAKRNLVDTIYKQAVLEGISTTFALTETIIEGGEVSGISSTDVLKVLDLKHAWEFVLSEGVLLSPTDYNLLCEINKLCIEGFYSTAGKIRSVPVKIGGTSWMPGIPIESDVKDELNKIINKKNNKVDKAIELLLYTMKKQIYVDGNKRTAVIFANHYLIKNGLGIISIPSELTDEFKLLLINYYESKNIKEIKSFLKTKCYTKI